MAKTWILYDRKEKQVRWPPCLKKLSSVSWEHPLKNHCSQDFSDFLEDAIELDRIFSTIRSLTVLGTCKTSQYLLCPNIPEHHRENAKCDPRRYGESQQEYFQRFKIEQERYFSWIGGYYWVDFDVVLSVDESVMKLRMAFNWGDADCNDGYWGEVWQRNTGKKVADIRSTGDTETIIYADSELEKIIDFVTYVLMC